MNKESSNNNARELKEFIQEVLENGYCMEDEPDNVIYPTTQREIIEYMSDVHNIYLAQATISKYLGELNYFKNPITGRYEIKDTDLYAKHRDILLEYLKIRIYEVTISPKADIVSVGTRNLNTDLLYELIIDSYPEGHIKYILKGYNILRVAINKDYVPEIHYEEYPSFIDDIQIRAKKNTKPRVINRVNKD